jgi:DNA polymerase elongation subunit (family B)
MMLENKRNNRPKGNLRKEHIEEPIDLIEEMFEFDVPYTSRVCIDKDIRVGHWYNISVR